VNVRVKRFACSGGELAYIDEGEGPVVVLLHGFPASSYQWRELLPLLTGRFRVIAPDLLGSGGSVDLKDADLRIRAQAEYVKELLAGLGIDRFAAVGHSTGGGVAQLLALEADGLDAIVLLDPVAFDAWPWAEVRHVRSRFVDPLTAPDAAAVEAVVRSVFDHGIRQEGRMTEPTLNEYLRPWIGAGGRERFVRTLRGFDGTGLEGRDAELAAIGSPALILWGEDDPFLPSSLGERLNEAMPSSTLGLLPGCGHFLTEEAPETIFPMISEYLRARFSMEPHGHDAKDGVVMLQLERRPPWVDVADDEDDDWFDVAEPEENGKD
jgi:pimeloyl-ACP methyl ester carboxylesterase